MDSPAMKFREGLCIQKFVGGEWETICDGLPSKEAFLQWGHLVKSFPDAKLRMNNIVALELTMREHNA